MGKFILKRLLYMIPVLLGVAFLVFAILSLTPGDPGTIILGITAKPEDIASLNEQFGYNKPFLIRFFSYIKDIVLHFNLGVSYQTREPVINDIMAKFPNTLKLTIFSMSLSAIIGISFGIISAVKQYSALDHICVVTALAWVDADDAVFIEAWLAAFLWRREPEEFYSAYIDCIYDICGRAAPSDTFSHAGDNQAGVYQNS